MDHSDPPPAGGGAYTWNVPGKGVSISIDYDIVDRLSFDIMHGFGAVPRRGAEVGGILLGSAEYGQQVRIHVEGFVPVACEHLRGPSYLLSGNDLKGFEESLERWAPAPDKRIYAVGLYRSHTRETFELTPEDAETLEARFAAPTGVCLLVRPFATRVSEATFFVREGGRFSPRPASDVFPFRRKELGGGRPPRREHGMESAPDARAGYPPEEKAPAPAAPVLSPAAATTASAIAEAPAARSKLRGGWVWIPLSFIFLLLGVALGFQIAFSYRPPEVPGTPPDPYQLELSVVQSGDELQLKWNPALVAFHTARRGVLHIQDGDNTKSMDLLREDLARGGVPYRHSGSEVKFRLEVFPRERTSITESVDIHLPPAVSQESKPVVVEPPAEPKRLPRRRRPARRS